MLHGHAKIELTNVKTGVKKVIEHDNMLTNWLRDIMSPKGLFGKNITACGNFMSQQGSRLDKTHFFGGLMVFQNELTADANDYKFPVDNKMIARGWNEAYSGNDTTVGSFNASQSVIGEDSATLVWDFTQERGNGTISALGLCNLWGAKMGAGVKTIQDTGICVNIVGPATFTPVYYFGNGNNQALVVHVDETSDTVYGIHTASFTDQKMVIGTRPLNQSNYNALEGIIDLNYMKNMMAEKTFEVDLSSYFAQAPAITVANGILYMLDSSTSWANGDTKTLVKLDLATRTITTQSVTNYSGYTINLTQYNNGTYFSIYNGRLYGQSGASNRYVYIDLTDNTDAGAIKDEDGADIVTSGSNVGRFFSLFGDFYFAIEGQNVTQANNPVPQLFVLKNKNTAMRRNISAPPYGYFYSAYAAEGGSDTNGIRGYVSWKDNNAYSMPLGFFNWMCMTTKQNLDSPVTKTSDMTMRVTYTIREAT